MADTEKITINLGPVDLGRIDVLVEQGLYANRTDVIRTAVRNLLDKQDRVVQDVATRKSFVLGALIIGRGELEKLRAENKRASYRIIGSLVLKNDIDPELARETIEAIHVRGVYRASPEVKRALADRTNL